MVAMTLTTLEQAILAHVHTLAVPQQRDVLTFVRTLATTPVGTPGRTLLAFANTIDREAVRTLQQTIAESNQHVDIDEW